MLKYKLTDQNLQTHNGFQWEINVQAETSGEGQLCGPGWLHYYHDPRLAVLLNPIHADIANPRLWECESEGQHLDDHGLKGGCTKLTITREIPLPEVTMEIRIRFAILSAKKVCFQSEWVNWADRWLSGEDRSETSASAAWAAAEEAWAAAKAAWAAAKAAIEFNLIEIAKEAFDIIQS